MKSLFALLVFCSGAFAYAKSGPGNNSEITDKNKAAVLKRVEAKSAKLFHTLAQIDDFGVGETEQVSSNCEVEDPKTGAIKCTVTDIDEEMGWTIGLAFSWDVDHAGQEHEIIIFNKVEFFSH